MSRPECPICHGTGVVHGTDEHGEPTATWCVYPECDGMRWDEEEDQQPTSEE